MVYDLQDFLIELEEFKLCSVSSLTKNKKQKHGSFSDSKLACGFNWSLL